MRNTRSIKRGLGRSRKITKEHIQIVTVTVNFIYRKGNPLSTNRSRKIIITANNLYTYVDSDNDNDNDIGTV